MVLPFFSHTLMAAYVAGNVQARRKLCKRKHRERLVISGNFNYREKGENILKHSSVSVVSRGLWLFNMRINRFSVKPGRLGLRTFRFCCKLSVCPPTALLGNQKAPSRSAALLQKTHMMLKGQSSYIHHR